MRLIVCDKCGKEKAWDEKFCTVKLVDVLTYSREVDLCSKCFDDLQDWMFERSDTKDGKLKKVNET